MKPFTSIPFLRISIPFIAGILMQVNFNTTAPSWPYLFVVLALVFVLVLLKPTHFPIKFVMMGVTDVFLFILALNLTWRANTTNNNNYYGNYINTGTATNLIVYINDVPALKQEFIKCQLTVIAAKKDSGYLPTDGKIIAYFKKDSPGKYLRAGQCLLLKTKLLEIPPPGNPCEFDYKNYLYNKQVYHIAFVDSAAFAVIPNTGFINPVTDFALSVKTKVIERLRNSALNSESFAICTALLTGFDDEVNKSIIEAFSHSGTLHVLSVSGLHAGLIYKVLIFFMGLIDRKNRYKLLRFIIVSIILWLFALFTGFSAPVLRAVIMVNLVGIGGLYFRNNSRNQLNILCFSAFALLWYNPYFITDVGFVLSYTAMGGLIYFQPRLNGLWQPRNLFLKHLWSDITASVAATISTLPVTLFYFRQFPLWFFICNVVVVPLTFILLLLTVVVVLKISFAAYLINCLVSFMLFFINLFNLEGIGYLDNIDFNTVDAFFLTLLIVLLSLVFKTRKFCFARLTCMLLLCWQLFGIYNSYTSKSQKLFTVYNIKNKSIYSLKNGCQVYLNKYDNTAHGFRIKPHLISFNYPEIITGAFNFFQYHDKCVLVLDKQGFWPNVNLKTVSILIVANNFKLREKDMKHFEDLHTIVAGASNNKQVLKKTEQLCRKFALAFYDIKHNGAFLMPLK